jgi:hypothetical protein
LPSAAILQQGRPGSTRFSGFPRNPLMHEEDIPSAASADVAHSKRKSLPLALG